MRARCCYWILSALMVLVLLIQETECLARRSWPKPEYVRISGGSAEQQGQFPFQIMLIEDGVFVCGGSIINEWTVLTAAHCIDSNNSSPQRYSVLAGKRDIRVFEQFRSVNKVLVHANYDPKRVIHDVAVLHVSAPFNFTNGVQPVGLSDAKLDRISFHSPCIASGWGSINNGDLYPNKLRWARVQLAYNRKCNRILQLRLHMGRVSINNICSVDFFGNGTCSGDSGGPMGCYVNGVYRQVGVTSWGPGDCHQPPNVFARVTYYRRWIKQNTKTAPNNDS